MKRAVRKKRGSSLTLPWRPAWRKRTRPRTSSKPHQDHTSSSRSARSSAVLRTMLFDPEQTAEVSTSIVAQKEELTVVPTVEDEENVEDRLSVGRFKYGCKHYRRRCRIRAPCCNEIFDCRHCHNEAKNINEVDDSKRHDIPRHHVEKVICSLCDHEQDVKQVCDYCGVCMGNYYCEKCKYFNDQTEFFHCDACGLCLTGCRENFFHCDRCGWCFHVDAELETGHSCAEDAHPLSNLASLGVDRGFQIDILPNGQQEIRAMTCSPDHQQGFESCSSDGDSIISKFFYPEIALQGFRECDRRCACDGCKSVPILNKRWHCNICIDYDLCEVCYKEGYANPLFKHKDHPMTYIPVNNSILKEEYKICTCDQCNQNPILGDRWYCKICNDFDLCEACYNDTEYHPSGLSHLRDHPMIHIQMDDQYLKRLVNNSPLKEENKIYICDQCGQNPIFSVCWHCKICIDFDLCEACYNSSEDNPFGLSHLRDHPMIHIQVDDEYLKGLGYGENSEWDTSSPLGEEQELLSSSTQQEISHDTVVDNDIDEDEIVKTFWCDGCNLGQVANERWLCNICPDFNLCWECYNTGGERDEDLFGHSITHSMTCIPVGDLHREYDVLPLFAPPSDMRWSYDGSTYGRGFYWIPTNSSTVPTLGAFSASQIEDSLQQGELFGITSFATRNSRTCVDSTTKNKVFLSHAGPEKEFVRQLWVDLEIIHQCGVFFDQDEYSLPLAEEFPKNIKKAARECELAIVVISNDYFLRKWPMLELAIFVEEHKKHNSLKILPLFYKLTVDQVKESKRQEVWFKKWKMFATPSQIAEWKNALQVLCTFKGKSFLTNEVEYRAEIKKTILESIPPYVMISNPAIEGNARLSKVILENLKIPPNSEAQPFLVGMFGMGGEGKTTLSKMICDYLFLQFNGRICHIEFDGNCKYKKVVCQVLQRFTNLKNELKVSTKEEGHNLLRRHLVQQPVFLVLDNVWDDQNLEEVEKYLQLPFYDGSIVLVTARTTEILAKITIPSRCKWGNIFAVPSLEIGEARSFFAKRAGCSLNDLSTEQKQHLERFTAACCFDVFEPDSKRKKPDPPTRKKYNPLAIKVLAAKVIGSDPLQWREEAINFKSETNEESDVLFQVLRMGFEALPIVYQRLFIDVVLYVDIQNKNHKPSSSIYNCLHRLYNEDGEKIRHMLEVMKARSLLKNVTDDGVYIHDLYIEFAQHEAKRKGCSYFGGKCHFYNRRLIINGTSMTELTVKEDLGYEVLQTEWLIVTRTKIKTLDLRGMKCLVNLQVEGNDCLETIHVENIRTLQQLQWNFGSELGFEFEINLPSLAGMVELRHLTIRKHHALLQDAMHRVRNFGQMYCESYEYGDYCSDEGVEESDGWELHYFSDCTNLESLTLRNLPNIRVLPDLEPLKDSLERLHLQDLMNMVELPDLRWLTSLIYLTIKDLRITQLAGLENLVKLEVLNLRRCRYITTIPGIEFLLELQVLCLRRLKALATLPSLSHLHKLYVLEITECNQLTSLEELGPLPSLKTFKVRCKKLITLPDLSGSPLKEVRVHGPLINNIPGLENLSKLKVLFCFKTSLTELPQLNTLRSLKKCDFSSTRTLEYLPEGLDLPALEELDLSYCYALKQLPQALDLPALKVLDLGHCVALEQIVAVSGLKSLRTLDLGNCSLLWYLPETMALPALEKLSFKGCRALQQLPDLSGCKALKLLKLCDSLVDPNMVKLPNPCTQDEGREDPSPSAPHSPRQVDNTTLAGDTVQEGDTSTVHCECAIL